MSAGILVGTAVVYSRIPSITKHYMEKLQGKLTETILEQVPVPKMPELPKSTGPAIRSPF
tara:strand:+ start:182 stop:361 length:180 start_codon:yes stop_codon:yes gene_type:complete